MKSNRNDVDRVFRIICIQTVRFCRVPLLHATILLKFCRHFRNKIKMIIMVCYEILRKLTQILSVFIVLSFVIRVLGRVSLIWIVCPLDNHPQSPLSICSIWWVDPKLLIKSAFLKTVLYVWNIEKSWSN